MTMNVILTEIYDFAASMCMELFFVGCFAIGFSLIRVKGAKFSKSSNKFRQQLKVVHAEVSSGNPVKAISSWRSLRAESPGPSSCETLKAITQAFLDTDPSSLVSELLEHLANDYSAANSNIQKVCATVLEVVAKAGEEEIMENLFEEFTNRLHISATPQLHEIMLGGYASAGNEEKADNFVASLRESRQKVSVRGYSLMIKSFLRKGMLDAALKQIDDMLEKGWSVPPVALSELFRVARDKRRTVEVFRNISEKISMTGEVAGIILEDCLALQDIELAKAVEKQVRQAKVQLSFPASESLLKIFISAGDMHALEVFEEMTQIFSYISDGFCISLISRCAESKLVRMAEALVAFQRARSKMSLVAYSALMKVYSHSNMYGEACDLYDQLVAEGLEPDSIMYGCLMKFSAECGRTDLTRELFSKAPGHDIHHHMAMIRAAGQDKNVDRAFEILENMKSSGVALDTFACNSVLDVCSSVGNMKRARGLVAEMREHGSYDMITYNTLLKGYASCGDVRGAKETIAEMEEIGLEPNDISYNSLINMAASAGDFQAAWATIETMERKSVNIDHYTVSTMMKALKRSQAPRDAVGKVMALLDRHHIDLCCEEVLLNTAVEACIKHGEHKRLGGILAHVESKRSSMPLATHTYGTLIRASGILKRMNQCRDLWKDMTEVRGLEPNGVTLGCMLDALSCNGCVVEGLALLRKWEDKVPANTVIYSTLIKGFGNTRNSKCADEVWEELIAKKLPLNTVVYNAIIDAHARLGSVDRVAALVESMEPAGCKPDDITWSMVAKGYCMVGDVDKAYKVFCNMKSESTCNTVIMFNTILDGCVRHSRNDLADEMLAKMEHFNIRPTNFTLGIIVKMCGRRFQLKRAFEYIKTLPKEYGFTPNGPVLTCLFFACLRNDALDSALQAFQDHRAGGHPVEVKMFTALVSSCTRAGRLERAVSCVEEAYGLAPGGTRRVLPCGEDLELACLEQLLKALSRRGLMQKVGMPLLKKMRTAKVSIANSLVASSLGQDM